MIVSIEEKMAFASLSNDVMEFQLSQYLDDATLIENRKISSVWFTEYLRALPRLSQEPSLYRWVLENKWWDVFNDFLETTQGNT